MRAQRAFAEKLEIKEPEADGRAVELCDPGLKLSEDAIRERSRLIWEREGCPEGHSEEHWNRARAELAELLARTSNAQHESPPEMDTAAAGPPCGNSAAADIEQIDAVEVRDLVESSAVQADGEGFQPPVLETLAVEAHNVEQAVSEVPDAETSECAIPVLQDDVEPASASPAANNQRPLRLPTVRRSGALITVPSIIAEGIEFQGTLKSPGDIQFDGCMEGTLSAAALVVDEHAVVRGDVVADRVTVRGRVNGRICARTVFLCCGCRVEGEIFYQSFAVEIGAQADCRFQPLGAEATEG